MRSNCSGFFADAYTRACLRDRGPRRFRTSRNKGSFASAVSMILRLLISRPLRAVSSWSWSRSRDAIRPIRFVNS